jgi:DNA-binding XRE family transcriptional regulator
MLKNNVQKYRIWKGLYQKELADKIGISTSYLRGIEKFIFWPSLKVRIRFCEFFGVNHRQLFDRNQEVAREKRTKSQDI